MPMAGCNMGMNRELHNPMISFFNNSNTILLNIMHLLQPWSIPGWSLHLRNEIFSPSPGLLAPTPFPVHFAAHVGQCISQPTWASALALAPFHLHWPYLVDTML